MLKRVDRVQIAVNDRAAAQRTVAAILGAEVLRTDAVDCLAAKRTTMQVGTSLIELLEPSGEGAVRSFIERWGGGLFAGGFSVDDLDKAAAHLSGAGVQFVSEGGQLHIDPGSTFGMRVVISVHHERAPLGAVRHIYEVTNVVKDWRAAANRYATILGLDQPKFVPVISEVFGYTGTLTMFDKPARLDRIEISEVTHPESAMGRFYARRGDSLYMFFLETDDVDAIAKRLDANGARHMKGATDARGMDGLFIHPSAFCGVLVGVSRTEHAWTWSGDPERARRAAQPR